jgi:hypothetical protein
MGRLVKAIVKNLKGVDEIDIVFGDITEIAGEEATGKSSFMDGVLWAFQGTRPIQDDPIRDGEDAAGTILVTDKVTITREYLKDPSRPNGYRTTLKIKGKDGGTYNQSYLNEIFPNLVDPSRFFDMQPAEIVETLLGFLSEEERCQLVVIDDGLKRHEEERLTCTRMLKRIGVPEEVEKVETVSAAELVAQKEEIVAFNKEQDEQRRKIEIQSEDISTQVDVLNDLERQIEVLTTSHKAAQEELNEMKVFEHEEPQDKKSTDAIDEQITQVDDTNAKATLYQNYLDCLEQREDIEKDHEVADHKIKKLRADKKKIMAEATLPGDNPVEITGDSEVLVSGRPMDQLSTSEKILFSAELAMAHNPSPDVSGRIRTLVIRRGESLGAKTYEKLCVLREKYHYQLLIESVGDGHSSDAIILEEGKVKEDE